jgi:hypothetical protein
MTLLKCAVAAVFAFAFASAYAFHDGGVAKCDGCHVMHNASNGKSVTTAGGQPARSDKTNPYLLQGSDQSSTCLICHGGTGKQYTIADLSAVVGVAPANYTPGGDFGYMLRTYSWTTSRGTSGSSPAERHGHNVIARDFGLTSIDNSRAPGGAFMSGTGIAALACSSCHDPHGRYRLQGDMADPVIRGPMRNDAAINPIVASGSYAIPAEVNMATEAVGVYRLLAGKDYRPASNPGFPFVNDPPVAVAPDTYNQVETASEVRVAYGSGMSEWCQNCHTYVHLDNYATGADGLVHPAGNGGKFRQLQADIYNKYKGSGDLTGTFQYTSLVPFESQETNLTTLGSAASSTSAPGSQADGIFVAVANTSNVMCLSCHRAHASAWNSMVRWNMESTFETFATYPGTNASGEAALGEFAQGRTMDETKAGYYGRDIGAGIAAFNRSLCNKCHAKD